MTVDAAVRDSFLPAYCDGNAAYVKVLVQQRGGPLHSAIYVFVRLTSKSTG